MSNKNAIICNNCKATLVGDMSFCPFCDTKIVIENKNNTLKKEINTNNDLNANTATKPTYSAPNLPPLSEIKNSIVKFIKNSIQKTKQFINEFPTNISTKPAYLLSFSLFFLCLFIILFFCGSSLVNTVRYNSIRNNLIKTEVDTVTIKLPEEDFITNMLPVDNKQSIYENSNCSMFQYESINKKDEAEKCIVSVYIQPLTNLLDRRVYNNFGSITTDSMTITMSIENEPNCKAPIDLLFFNKKDIASVERLNNFSINETIFEAYRFEDKFYLVAHLVDDYFLTYQATMKNPDAYENFNQIFHIIFAIDIETEKVENDS